MQDGKSVVEETRERLLGIGKSMDDGVLAGRWEKVKLGLQRRIAENVKEVVEEDQGDEVHSEETYDEEKKPTPLRRSKTRSGIPVRMKKEEKKPQQSQSVRQSKIPIRKTRGE
jgi:hypothetical protein